jgi:hypothetical protein
MQRINPFQSNSSSKRRDRHDQHDQRFTPVSPQMFHDPMPGSIEIYGNYPPCVRFEGSLWHFRVCGSGDTSLTNGQSIKVIGLHGNCLLVEV